MGIEQPTSLFWVLSNDCVHTNQMIWTFGVKGIFAQGPYCDKVLNVKKSVFGG